MVLAYRADTKDTLPVDTINVLCSSVAIIAIVELQL
jgi:hypothetical protein